MADSNFIDGLKTEFQKLNEPELTVLRTDVDALKPRVDALERVKPIATVVETWDDNNNWWRKWSDGFIEQGGRAFPNREVDDYTVSFNASFSRKLLTVQTKFNGSNYDRNTWVGVSVSRLNVSVHRTSLSNFTVQTMATPFYWYACGY